MKIIHLNTFDNSGGAARAAGRLDHGLRSLGLDSHMFVLHKSSVDSHVREYSFDRSIPHRLGRKLLRLRGLESRTFKPMKEESLELFSTGRSPWGKHLLSQVGEADVINLHWVVGMFDHEHLANVQSPLVWTLHDMHPFTGGCHFSGECKRFQKNCGRCPQLASNAEQDISRRTWQTRSHGLDRLKPNQLTIVTPSGWLAEQSASSSLLGRFPTIVIPNGLDTNTFQPRNRFAIREVLGIPHDAQVVLFLADSLANRRKGIDLLYEAIPSLRNLPNLHLLTVGQQTAPIELGIPATHLQRITDDRYLSFIYSAADVFVIPSREDNLPNTIMEALACGTPSVGFSIGGIPDMIQHGETGYLASPYNTDELANAIAEILQNESLRERMSEVARKHALSEYSFNVQAERYRQLYTQVLNTEDAL